MSIELRSWWYADDYEPGDDPQSYYSGTRLELIVDGRVYVLSRNDDRLSEVDFHGTRAEATPTSATAPLSDFPDLVRMGGGVPYDDPNFVKAARWLLNQSGIETLRVYTDDLEFAGTSFVKVDPQRLTINFRTPHKGRPRPSSRGSPPQTART